MLENIFSVEPTIVDNLTTTDDEILDSEKSRDLDHAKVKDLDSNRELKKKLADKTFNFMIKFTNFIGIILMFYVGHFIMNKQAMPENVVIALITTTFATVVGLVGFILKGLFGNGKD